MLKLNIPSQDFSLAAIKNSLSELRLMVELGDNNGNQFSIALVYEWP